MSTQKGLAILEVNNIVEFRASKRVKWEQKNLYNDIINMGCVPSWNDDNRTVLEKETEFKKQLELKCLD